MSLFCVELSEIILNTQLVACSFLLINKVFQLQKFQELLLLELHYACYIYPFYSCWVSPLPASRILLYYHFKVIMWICQNQNAVFPLKCWIEFQLLFIANTMGYPLGDEINYHTSLYYDRSYLSKIRLFMIIS